MGRLSGVRADVREFELHLEANPDWPADTAIYLRKLPHSFHGIQVLVDHRKSGSIGGF
jgi:hypothetical protein